MQLKMADSAPGVATWRTGRNSLILAHLLHYVKTRHHPQNWKYINVLHYRQKAIEPWPHVTCTEKLVKFWVFFKICERTDKQKDTHTHTLIAILIILIRLSISTAQYAVAKKRNGQIVIKSLLFYKIKYCLH